MLKTLLIARREYFAFVKTLGFWLSLITVPGIIVASAVIPIMLTHTTPVKNVAVLDLSGAQAEAALNAAIDAHDPAMQGPVTLPPAIEKNAMARSFVKNIREKGGYHRVPLPVGLSDRMTPDAADAAAARLMASPHPGLNELLIAYQDAQGIHFHLWSPPGEGGDLSGLLQSDLDRLEFGRIAAAHGVGAEVTGLLQSAHADIIALSPGAATGKDARFKDMLKTNGPRLVGVIASYLAWMSIFSSSMILLTGVIEEKSSKVIEVLLASASTDSLLIGKVLGVGLVMLSVAAIWMAIVTGLVANFALMIPPHILSAIGQALGTVFVPERTALMAAYFVMGYMMYGVCFAAIGSFCETPKDAQAIMGPIMMVLLIPMLTIQSAFISPDIPVIRYLSWIPLFTPFLMPLRLVQGVPWYEVAATLGGMAVFATFMARFGGRAYRQGALGGGKLSWSALGRILRGQA